MRRMPTTKQVELIEYLSKVTKINNYQDEIKVSFAYINKEELESALEDAETEETLSFENHTIDSDSLYFYYYLTPEDAELADTNYVTLTSENEIVFPETINTISDLANWLIANGIPAESSPNLDDVSYQQEGYDFGGYEFEYDGHVVILTGEKEYDQSILSLGTDQDRILKLYAYNIFAYQLYGPLGTTTQHDHAYVSSLNAYGNVVINGNYTFRGQLGTDSSRKNAYVNNLNASSNIQGVDVAATNGIGLVSLSITEDDDGLLSTGSVLKCIGDAGLELFTEGNLKIESDINRIIMVLPTSDPGVEGALWDDNGVLKISHPAP